MKAGPHRELHRVERRHSVQHDQRGGEPHRHHQQRPQHGEHHHAEHHAARRHAGAGQCAHGHAGERRAAADCGGHHRGEQQAEEVEGADQQQVAGVATDAVEERVDTQCLAPIHGLRARQHAGHQHRQRDRRRRPAEEGQHAERGDDHEEDQGLDDPGAGGLHEQPPAFGQPVEGVAGGDVTRGGWWRIGRARAWGHRRWGSLGSARVVVQRVSVAGAARRRCAGAGCRGIRRGP